MVSFVGFENLTFTVDNNQPQEYQLSLSNRFDEIIVSASRKAEKLQVAPAAVSVISARQVTASLLVLTSITLDEKVGQPLDKLRL